MSDWVDYVDGETGYSVCSVPRGAILACSHSGACDSDVAWWLDKVRWHMSAGELAVALKGYGAWDDLATADTDTLRSRMLWLACGDLKEQGFAD